MTDHDTVVVNDGGSNTGCGNEQQLVDDTNINVELPSAAPQAS
jgi:hypothetical protein